jgi:hypothetical protein
VGWTWRESSWANGVAITGLTFFSFDGIKDLFQIVQPFAPTWRGIENLSEIGDGVGNRLNGAGQRGSARVGMPATLQLFGNFQRLSAATAKTDKDHAIGTAEEGKENGVGSGLLFKQLVNNKIGIADDSSNQSHRGTEFDDVFTAPRQAYGIFNPAFDRHDFQEWMVKQTFRIALEQRLEVPELVRFHQVRVIAGKDEVGIIFQEEVGDIAQMNEPIEYWIGKAVLLTEFVTEERSGLGGIMNENGVFGGMFDGVVIDDDPVGFVEAWFEREVTDPAGRFDKLAVSPIMVVEGLDWNIVAKETPGQELAQEAGQKTVQIAFVRENNFGFWQRHHGPQTLACCSLDVEW